MSTLVENELHVAFMLFASLRDKGRIEEASVIAERALEQASTSLGESHPATATALFNLAAVYEGKGEFETALRLATRAVASYERLVGASHPVLASPLNLLGMLHQQLGHYAVPNRYFCGHWPLRSNPRAISTQTLPLV